MVATMAATANHEIIEDKSSLVKIRDFLFRPGDLEGVTTEPQHPTENLNGIDTWQMEFGSVRSLQKG